MTVQDDAALEAETRAILEAAGARRVRVEGAGDHWLVSAHFGSTQRLGHTGISAETSYDPRDLARRLIAREGAPHTPALAEDEDPGEQDLGAEMLAAQDEAGENLGDGESLVHRADEGAGAASDFGEASASADEMDDASGDGGDVSVYPGIAILPDELGARRNAVLAAITTEKLTRLSIAMDPSRADFLAARFADYQNAGALGLPIDEALAADYRAFQELRDRRDRITNYAMQLEQSALDGDMDRLEAMHAGLGIGWPT